MNKRGNVGAVGAIILFLVFLLNWFIWLGAWLTQVGNFAITSSGATGVEAFVYSNLNLVVLIAMILGIMGFMYFGGGQQ